MRNFTREGAAVSSGHTQRLEYPYPRHTPGGGAAAQLAGRAVLRRGATRRRARLRGAGLPTTGRRGRGAVGTPNSAATGRTLGAATGRGRIPGRRATGANRPLSGANTAYFRVATGCGALPAARAATCARAGRIPGRGYPGGRRGGTAYPGRGGYPAAAPPAKITVFRRLVTGSRRTRSLCAFPRRGYPAARRKKIFFPGRGFLCRNTGLAHIARLYRSGASGRGYGDTH